MRLEVVPPFTADEVPQACTDLRETYLADILCSCSFNAHFNVNAIDCGDGAKFLPINGPVRDLIRHLDKEHCETCYNKWTLWCHNFITKGQPNVEIAGQPCRVELKEWNKKYTDRMFIIDEIDCDMAGSWMVDRYKFINGEEVSFQRLYLDNINEWKNKEELEKQFKEDEESRKMRKKSRIPNEEKLDDSSSSNS